jgi:hypothetical protein
LQQEETEASPPLSVAVFGVDAAEIAAPVAVISVQQLIRRGLAGFDAVLERVEEMRLIRHQTTGPGAGAGLEARLGEGQHLTREIVHVDVAHAGLKPVHAGGDAQGFAGVSIPALDDVPCRIERGLVIHQTDPEGGQGA